MRYAKTQCVLNVFGRVREAVLKNSQKLKAFDRFILRPFGPSSAKLDRYGRDLCASVALSAKRTPLCSRLLVFFRSMSGWRPKPSVLQGLGSIMIMSATLQPFAYLCLFCYGWALRGGPGRSGGPWKSSPLCSRLLILAIL